MNKKLIGIIQFSSIFEFELKDFPQAEFDLELKEN